MLGGYELGLVVMDTDVLAIHHIFTWDKRYNISRRFLENVTRPVTTIHNLLELISIAFRVRRTDLGMTLYKYYMLSCKWTILFPEIPIDWNNYCDNLST